MSQESYLDWVIRDTPTCWWHDSADPHELDVALQHGAVGVTTNPFLCHLALATNRVLWAKEIQAVLAACSDPEERAESLMRIPVITAARKLLPEFERSQGRQGYVCAQVCPTRAGDRPAMWRMARRFCTWSPNIAVKLPATAAGLDVLEQCVAAGITVTATVSFTVPQVIAVAERYRQGIRAAQAAGQKPGRCFAVLMVGRLDDYLRDLAEDARADITPADIRQAGIAVAKRACIIYRQRGYEAGLIIAALRGTYHMTELAGGEVIMSIAPAFQQPLQSPQLPREPRIDRDVDPAVIRRLSSLRDFVRAYEPDGMSPAEFISYGVTQKTLAQFHESGWRLLETFHASM